MPRAVVLKPAERRRLARRLRDRRIDLRLARLEVCRRIGKSEGAVRAYERDGWVPDPATRAAYADLYGVPEEELFAEYYAALALLESAS